MLASPDPIDPAGRGHRGFADCAQLGVPWRSAPSISADMRRCFRFRESIGVEEVPPNSDVDFDAPRHPLGARDLGRARRIRLGIRLGTRFVVEDRSRHQLDR